MRAIGRSDVVLMVSMLKKEFVSTTRIAGFAHEAEGIIIVVNKWDTLEKDNHTMKTGKNIRDQFQYLSYAPIISLFCLY